MIRSFRPRAGRHSQRSVRDVGATSSCQGDCGPSLDSSKEARRGARPRGIGVPQALGRMLIQRAASRARSFPKGREILRSAVGSGSLASPATLGKRGEAAIVQQ